MEPAPTFCDPKPFAFVAQGQSLMFHPAGAERLEALLELIGAARERLQVSFYIFAGDGSGIAVRDALAAAAARGVDVSLIVDGFGTPAREAFFRPLREAGGRFCWFSPRWTQRYLIRNHQKIVIADGRIAMIGGFNVADDYFGKPENGAWSDLAITIEGSAVDALTQWFVQLERWTRDPRPRWRTIRNMVRDWQAGDGPVRVLIGGPTRGLSSWARCVRADLTRARRLSMLMAYFSPSNRLVRLIGRVARRERALLVLAGKSDNGATIGATRSLYDYLLRRRAQVWEFEATKLHTKMIVIDDVCYFGSANFDMRSLYLNLEVMLRIEDRALAERLTQYIEDHLTGSRKITPLLHKERAGLLNRVRWNLSWFLVAVVDYTVSRRLNLGL
jgi:cardiolipin synthase A/B